MSNASCAWSPRAVVTPLISQLAEQPDSTIGLLGGGDRVSQRERDLRQIEQGPRECRDIARGFGLPDRLAQQPLRPVVLLLGEGGIAAPLQHGGETRAVVQLPELSSDPVEQHGRFPQLSQTNLTVGRNQQTCALLPPVAHPPGQRGTRERFADCLRSGGAGKQCGPAAPVRRPELQIPRRQDPLG
jgi:hypothetical protein